MFIRKYKARHLKRKIEKLLQNEAVTKVTTTDKIKSVGILASDDFFGFNLQDQALTYLEARNSKLYSFRKFNKDDEQTYKHFTEKDVDWKGVILDSSLKSFLEQPFDLLVCYFKNKEPLLLYTALRSQAKFKVGFTDVHPNLFHMEINVSPANFETFFEETKKYLSILNKL